MNKLDLGYCKLFMHIAAESDILVGARTAQVVIDNKQVELQAFFQGIDPHSGQPNCLIPATSIKGVLRSTGERILRSFDTSLACDPLTTEGRQSPASKEAGLPLACSKQFENWSRDAASLYARLCPACRLFGATAYVGALTVEDAILDRDSLPVTESFHWAVDGSPEGELRTRIGIDRWTGGIRTAEGGSGATQRVLVLPSGSNFRTTLRLRNFSLWQLGLLAACFRSLNTGWTRLGAGTRKGMGRIRVEVTRMEFRYPTIFYRQALDQRPNDQEGVLCAPQHLMNVSVDPDMVEERAWFGVGLPTIKGQNWYDQGWTTFEVNGEESTYTAEGEESKTHQATTEPTSGITAADVFQHAVEKSLAPRLMAKRGGFFREDVCE